MMRFRKRCKTFNFTCWFSDGFWTAVKSASKFLCLCFYFGAGIRNFYAKAIYWQFMTIHDLWNYLPLSSSHLRASFVSILYENRYVTHPLENYDLMNRMLLGIVKPYTYLHPAPSTSTQLYPLQPSSFQTLSQNIRTKISKKVKVVCFS